MNKDLIYLVQTDTTAGFLSNNDKRLAHIKNRPQNKKILQAVKSFKTLNSHTRVPKKFRKIIRNSIQTTFVYPNGSAYRVVDKNSIHYNFIKKFSILYSTSANKAKSCFDIKFALKKADIIVENSIGFYEAKPSKIFKITSQHIIAVR